MTGPPQKRAVAAVLFNTVAHCRALRVELRKPWTYLASHGWNMKDIAAVLAQATDHTSSE